MTEQKMNLGIWYGKSVRVPSFNSRNFIEFTISSLGLVRSIVRRTIGQKVKVKFQRGGTACAVFDEQTIYINRNYINGQIIEGKQSSSEETIVTIMGILVHEAGHFAYSPDTLVPYIDCIERETPFLFNRNVARTVANTLEDIFIEAELDRRIPSLTWTLEFMNEMLFSEAEYQENLLKVATIEDAPEGMEDLTSILNLLIYAKTRPELPLGNSDYVTSLFNLTRSAVNASELDERIELGVQVYNMVMAKLDANGEEGDGDGDNQGEEGADDNDGQSQGSGKPQDSNADAEGESLDDKVLEALAKKSEGLATIYASSDGVKNPDSTSSRDEHDVIQRTLKNLEAVEVSYAPNDWAGRHDATNIFLEKALEASPNYTLEVDARYARLSELGRQRATANRPYGEDRNRGTHIRKLYRIATDNKIFAQPVEMNTYKPMQVAILIDSSSSMGTMTYDSKGDRKTRIELATEAAAGAALALLEGHCDVAVYGHTADLHLGNECVIYRAKGFAEGKEGLEEKIARLKDDNLQSCNRDGYAIQYVGNKFTDQRKRRIVIVISDGRPSGGNGYSGFEGVSHAKSVVEDLKKKGVECMCISITNDASTANDSIFGADKNVFNEDPNVIQSIIKTLMGA